MRVSRTLDSEEGGDEVDELTDDRPSSMPLIGLISGTFVSLALWGVVVAIVAWSV